MSRNKKKKKMRVKESKVRFGPREERAEMPFFVIPWRVLWKSPSYFMFLCLDISI